jgi:hypothetical protein
MSADYRLGVVNTAVLPSGMLVDVLGAALAQDLLDVPQITDVGIEWRKAAEGSSRIMSARCS